MGDPSLFAAYQCRPIVMMSDCGVGGVPRGSVVLPVSFPSVVASEPPLNMTLQVALDVDSRAARQGGGVSAGSTGIESESVSNLKCGSCHDRSLYDQLNLI